MGDLRGYPGGRPGSGGASLAAASAEPVLSAHQIVKRFGGLEALRGVDLEVREGEILGLIGPNGAGKTTLFNVITGFLAPTAGTVRFAGQAIEGQPPHRLARMGLVRTFQITRPFRGLSVAENVGIGFGHRLYGHPWQMLRRYGGPEHRQAVAEVLELVGLAEYGERRAGSLPIGLQRRLDIARALAMNPRVLLLDEPVAGLNPQEAQEMADLIRRLHAGGLTVLMVEHNMSIAMNLCQRMVVLHNGRRIADGPPEAVASDPAVIEAYLGEGRGQERGQARDRNGGQDPGRDRGQDRGQARNQEGWRP